MRQPIIVIPKSYKSCSDTAAHHIYGSSRLGIHQTKKELRNRYKQEEIFIPSNLVNTTALYRGKRNYELSNHLGNVNVVISDKRKSVCDEELGVEYFVAEVLSAVDYYPFGMVITDKQWYAGNDTGNYRHGFNGQEKDDELIGTGNHIEFRFRNYDTRRCQFWSLDPLEKEFAWYSPYIFAGNSPIAYIDLYGLQKVLAITYKGSGEKNRPPLLEKANHEKIKQTVITTDPARQILESLIGATKTQKGIDGTGIGFVAIWGHGTPSNQWGEGTGYLKVDDLSLLISAIKDKSISFDENAIIFLGNCNAGTPNLKGESFAQELADITGVTVVAGATDEYGSEEHRGSVGPTNPENEDLSFEMWHPSKDNFREFRRGSTPIDLGGTVDVISLLYESKRKTPIMIQSKPIKFEMNVENPAIGPANK